ncbi:MAG: GNAT family N-acetyltransferase [Alphaproteobacteria bacterium]|nr:GNAT family N-acetyltransferase [Alphaproteobacteria bacterium]
MFRPRPAPSPTIHIRPIAPAEAVAACRWRYPPPFDYYDLHDDDVAVLLEPEWRYHVATDQTGRLLGIACFGEDAQVVGGSYDQPALDIGMGLAPALIGRGLGEAFVRAVVAHGVERYAPPLLRLSVATFNTRARGVFLECGFTRTGSFLGTSRHGSREFWIMTRPAP